MSRCKACDIKLNQYDFAYISQKTKQYDDLCGYCRHIALDLSSDDHRDIMINNILSRDNKDNHQKMHEIYEALHEHEVIELEELDGDYN